MAITTILSNPIKQYQNQDRFDGPTLRERIEKIEDTDNKTVNEVTENIRRVKTSETIASDEVKVIDKDWVKNKAMASLSLVPQRYKSEMFQSNAHLKFQDSSLGGNEVINPKPQFTRYADIRADDLLVDITALDNKNPMRPVSTMDNTYNHGMGRYYSESIDDYKQVVYLQFGRPRFNGILTFLRNGVNYVDLYIANHGRKPWLYYIGKTLGYARILVCTPYLGFFMLGFYAVSKSLDIVFGSKPYSYYYLEPDMLQYWASANNIANQFLINMGMLVPYYRDTQYEKQRKAKEYIKEREFMLSPEDIHMINLAYGQEVISEKTSYLDVYAVATKYQQRINFILQAYGKLRSMKNVAKGEIPEIYASTEELAKVVSYLVDMQIDHFPNRINESLFWFSDDLKAYNDVVARNRLPEDGKLKVEKKKEQKKEENPKDPNLDSTETNESRTEYGTTSVREVPNAFNTEIKDDHVMKMLLENKENKLSERKFKNSYIQSQVDQAHAALRGASTHVALAVNYTGASSEGFSNSIGELAISEKLKSVQRVVKDAKLTIEGVVGDGFGRKVLDGLAELGNGLIDGLTFDLSGVIRSLLSGAYMDIPKVWEDSETSLPTVQFSMDLVTPYGNAFSRFQNIYLPLSLILAGALPRKVGNNSYTSPFLCSCFSKSVRRIKLGMITDLTIERGITNLAYNKSRKTNGIRVTFTVTDFAGKISAPINSSSVTDVFSLQFDGDTPFTDYLEVISGIDLYDITYQYPKIKRRVSSVLSNLQQSVSGLGFGFGEWVQSSGMNFAFSNRPIFTGR